MPTYEYECKQCGHVFEKFQQMTAEPLKQCPQCKGEVKRLIGSGMGMIFKGKGFYATDYKRKDVGTTSSEPTPPCGNNSCPKAGECGG